MSLLANNKQFDIMWSDSGKEPTQKPNPRYPHGIDIVATHSGEMGCKIALPYPAKRIGHYIVVCKLCGCYVRLSAAGRPDDPRSVTIPCRPMARI